MSSPVRPSSTRPPGAEEAVGCPLGCPAGDEPMLEGIDQLHGVPGRFQVVRCQSCGLMRTSPRPTMDAIGAFYPDPYGPHQASTAAAPDDTRWTARLARRLRWDGTRMLVPPIRPGRALEIGCATGALLRKVRARGWQVQGIEPSAGAAAIARQAGLDVHVGFVETAPDPASKYDLVFASHTLEHLHRPKEVFQRLHDWTNPAGWLTCAVPDASSFLFRRFREHWYDLDLPRHLYHYTPETLTRLLGDTGWQVERVMSQPTFNSFAGSLGYHFRKRKGADSSLARWFLDLPESRNPLKKLLEPATWLLTAMKQTGRMVVWARRR